MALRPTLKVKPRGEEEDRCLGNSIRDEMKVAAEMCLFGPHKDSDFSPVDEPPVWETALAF